MNNLSATTTDRHLRILILGGAALTAAALLLNLRDAMALLISHFNIPWQTAIFICTLLLDGSWLLYVWFPYIAPVGVTVQVLIYIMGLSAAAGW